MSSPAIEPSFSAVFKTSAELNVAAVLMRDRRRETWTLPEDASDAKKERAHDEAFADSVGIVAVMGRLTHVEHPRFDALFPREAAAMAAGELRVARTAPRAREPRGRVRRAVARVVRRASRASPDDSSSPDPPLGRLLRTPTRLVRTRS